MADGAEAATVADGCAVVIQFAPFWQVFRRKTGPLTQEGGQWDWKKVAIHVQSFSLFFAASLPVSASASLSLPFSLSLRLSLSHSLDGPGMCIKTVSCQVDQVQGQFADSFAARLYILQLLLQQLNF